MSYPLKLTTACLTALFLVACGADPGDTTEKVNDEMQEAQKEIAKADDTQEWMNERDEARKEMMNLREKLVNQRDRTQERLTDGVKDAKKRAELEALVAEYNTNIDRLDGFSPRLDGATDGNWEGMKNEMRTMSDSTSNWFDRQADKIDAKTDADKDNDGK